MYKIIGYISLAEFIGFLGFITISSFQELIFIRMLPLLLAFAMVLFIAYTKAKACSRREIAYIAIAVSIIFILVVQVLGFMVYPGLAKDMDFFSRENLDRTGVMLLVGIVGHFVLLSLARLGKKS